VRIPALPPNIMIEAAKTRVCFIMHRCLCNHDQPSLLPFNREGDCLAAKLRPSNVHSATPSIFRPEAPR